VLLGKGGKKRELSFTRRTLTFLCRKRGRSGLYHEGGGKVLRDLEEEIQVTKWRGDFPQRAVAYNLEETS